MSSQEKGTFSIQMNALIKGMMERSEALRSEKKLENRASKISANEPSRLICEVFFVDPFFPQICCFLKISNCFFLK